MNRTDVIIIGGGVSGMMCARELADSGKRIVLLERQALGRESSWAGGGILSPLAPWRAAEPITALCRWSQSAYPRLAEELMESTGIDPEWLPSGLLFSDCLEIDRAKAWADTHGIQYESLASIDLGRIEPNICAAGINPLLLPGIAQVRNPRLLRALRLDLTRRGVGLLEQHPVDEIKIERGRVVGVVACNQLLTAQDYVVTAGAWSGLLALNSGLPELPIMPVKGEMIIFDSPPGLLKHMVLSGGRYLIPRKDGKILAGSTVENAQFNKGITAPAFEALSAFATSLLPSLSQCAIEKHWAGLRPGSADGIPTIGPHPDVANLFFNCGHFRNGFVMAPASARLLASHVLQQSPIVPPEPYLP
ncbi:MAG: glycine oxidase ThiO, partial [Candidatus Methylumidiphilus sp.]